MAGAEVVLSGQPPVHARPVGQTGSLAFIAIHIVASVGAATPRGQTAAVLGVSEAKGDVAALAGVGLVCANVAA